MVVQLMARLFMDPLDDPFAAVENMLETWRLGSNAQAIVLDFHGEASSEKMAAGSLLRWQSFSGRGHSHIPAADAKFYPVVLATLPILECVCDYDSVIGIRKEISVERFVRKCDCSNGGSPR